MILSLSRRHHKIRRTSVMSLFSVAAMSAYVFSTSDIGAFRGGRAVLLVDSEDFLRGRASAAYRNPYPPAPAYRKIMAFRFRQYGRGGIRADMKH